MEVVKFLIQCDWSVGSQQQQSPQIQQQSAFTKSQAVQQALIAAASMGYTEVLRVLLFILMTLLAVRTAAHVLILCTYTSTCIPISCFIS